MKQHSQLERIDAQIILLERKARVLLDGLELDVEAMTPKQRADTAIKLVTLCQRYAVLRQRYEKEERSAGNKSAIEKLMRQMRGEPLEDSPEESEM